MQSAQHLELNSGALQGSAPLQGLRLQAHREPGMPLPAGGTPQRGWGCTPLLTVQCPQQPAAPSQPAVCRNLCQRCASSLPGSSKRPARRLLASVRKRIRTKPSAAAAHMWEPAAWHIAGAEHAGCVADTRAGAHQLQLAQHAQRLHVHAIQAQGCLYALPGSRNLHRRAAHEQGDVSGALSR